MKQLLALLALGSLAQGEGAGRISRAVLSASREGPDARVFPASLEKLWLRLELEGVPPDTPLTCAFLAEKAQAAPPEHELDQARLEVGGLVNRVTCNLNRPQQGWPPGAYRVEVYLGDGPTPTLQIRFQIVP
ncbi:hypothetical protein [Calidithermus roseus]|uniref:Uncharacterized protein n=1 Tax=Calidithermus roseus TaxID=1644118 RepID=A0A399EVM7_9DEIN|nr:hypothetical protein [Calidithermus roseus]RIH88098.1 hypothetical protein Mrose_01002 [Calidithermus roseus]